MMQVLRRPTAGPDSLVQEDPTPPPKIVIMGGPGCGKGSVSRAIIEKFGVVHISVGDILREHIANETEFGSQVEHYVCEGRLIPDELAINIVRERLERPDVKEKGYILDNFPRTGDQAEAILDMGIIPEKFLFIDVTELTLFERCRGRLTDPETGIIYHDRFAPPPDDPVIIARLVTREDDMEEATVSRRLELFMENMESVLDIFDDIKMEFEGEQQLSTLIRDVLAYIKPDAPLYARAATRPAITSADDVRAAYAARREEVDGPVPLPPAPPPAEGEEAPTPPPDAPAAEGGAEPPVGDAAGGEVAAAAVAAVPEWEGWTGVAGAVGDEYRRAVMDSILGECLGERFDERRDRIRMDRLTFHLAAEHAIQAMDSLIAVHTMEFDQGGSLGAAWGPGEEPVPASMDSWGRGAVPLKKKLTTLKAEDVVGAESSSRSRPTSGSSRGSRVSRGFGGGAAIPPSAVKKKAAKKEDKVDVKARTATTEEIEEERLRAILKAKQDLAASKSKRSKEYKAEVEKIEKMSKGMANRGQLYTTDEKGNMILVNLLTGDKIPAPLVNVRSTMGHTGPPPADPTFAHKGTGDSKAMAAGLKYFHPSDTVQPPAVESHRLVEGVTLVEGSSTREGPQREKDALHLTRKEYTTLLETQFADPNIALSESAVLEDKMEAPPPVLADSRSEEPAAASRDALLAADKGGEDGEGSIPMGGSGGGVDGLKAGGRAAVAVKSTVKVFDWEQRDYYVDNAIVDDPLARLKPLDPRLLSKAVGTRTKNPRQRAQYPDAFSSEKFLPAPVYPGTMGHGVVTSYLSNDNQFVRDPMVLKQRELDKSFPSASGSPPKAVHGSLNNSLRSEKGMEKSGPGTVLAGLAATAASKRAEPLPRVEYPRDFPKKDVPAQVTANAKLLKELRLDQ